MQKNLVLEIRFKIDKLHFCNQSKNVSKINYLLHWMEIHSFLFIIFIQSDWKFIFQQFTHMNKQNKDTYCYWHSKVFPYIT